MKNSLSLWQFSGFAITSLAGTLLHFLYDWSNKNVITAIFSATDESTFQHMKLLFFPLLLFAIIQSLFFKELRNFWYVKLIGILIGLTLIPVLFYTYNGVIGKSPDWINIGIFFVSAAVTFIVETRLFKKAEQLCNRSRLSLFIVCLIGIAFVVFTFMKPDLAIFKEPCCTNYSTVLKIIIQVRARCILWLPFPDLRDKGFLDLSRTTPFWI